MKLRHVAAPVLVVLLLPVWLIAYLIEELIGGVEIARDWLNRRLG